MASFPNKLRAPLFINEGILINKRDMLRSLETLECVTYKDMLDGKVINEGDGVIVKVFADNESGTLIVNGSIFVNVNSFDHLHFYPCETNENIIELVVGHRILKLIPREEDPRLLSRFNHDQYCEYEGMEGEGACARYYVEDYNDEDED